MNGPFGAALAVCLVTLWATTNAAISVKLDLKLTNDSCAEKICPGKRVCRIVVGTNNIVQAECLRTRDLPSVEGESCGVWGYPLLIVKEGKPPKNKPVYMVWRTKHHSFCPSSKFLPIHGLCCVDTPICMQPKCVGLCKASMPRVYYDWDQKKCLPFIYGGCGANDNNFESLVECQQTCADACKQPKDPGPCKDSIQRYYYDHQHTECRPFTYGGCLGNTNNFPSLETCDKACTDPCILPKDAGPCQGFFQRYYYDQEKMECLAFTYGGCFGNTNNFMSLEKCQKACANVCIQPMDPGPCKGSIPRYYYDLEKMECREFFYGGCLGNNNNFQSLEKCQKTCANACIQPKDPGPCKAAIERYYFDHDKMECHAFIYGGCAGNTNNFPSMDKCQNTCADGCKLPKDPGPCKGSMKRYYYDHIKLECRPFTYGGCLGNTNNFVSLEKCNKACADACKQPKVPGPCKGSFQRYYYDQEKMECLVFIYGGCDGNKNNFMSLEECQKVCPAPADMCPPVHHFKEGKICKGVRCEDSEDCKHGEICCNTTCGYKTCTTAQRTCADIECKPGYVCVDTPKGVECIKDKCPPVDHSKKRKNCKGVRCEDNEDCKDGEICCMSKCGYKTCTKPKLTCETLHCKPGTICEETRKGAKCKKIKVPKGKCPKVDHSQKGEKCEGVRCKNNKDCKHGQICCKTKCGYKTCIAIPVPTTCAMIDCKPGYICEETHKGAKCKKGCETPWGTFIKINQVVKNESGTICSCKKDTKTGGGVLECKCELPNGDLLSPGERNNDPCMSCTCDEETVTPLCATVSCFPVDCKDPFVPEGKCCPECPGCETPWGTFIKVNQVAKNESGTICSCKKDTKTGGVVLECKCELPNGDLLSPGERNNDPCMPCTCDEETVTPFCATVDCFPVDCENPFVPEGECCPVCPDLASLCPKFDHSKKGKNCGGARCEVDEDCKTGKICCMNKCGYKTCRRPMKTCGMIECKPGFVCEDTPKGPQCRKDHDDVCPLLDHSKKGKDCKGNRCEDNKDCKLGLKCCMNICGYKSCTIPFQTCGGKICKPGFVCDRTPKSSKCKKGCIAPWGTFIKLNHVEKYKPGMICSCKEDVKTGVGILDCKCELPNGDLLSPGERNNDPCMPCICDEESMAPSCNKVDCFPPHCEIPFVPEGKCCPECPEKP